MFSARDLIITCFGIGCNGSFWGANVIHCHTAADGYFDPRSSWPVSAGLTRFGDHVQFVLQVIDLILKTEVLGSSLVEPFISFFLVLFNI